MTDKPITVLDALAAVMADVAAVGKTGRNIEQGYDFRGIDAVINAVGPAFRKHGVIAVPIKSSASYRDVLTTREKRSRECTVSVTYRFYGPVGDYIDCEVPGESMDFGDKGAPKAMSVAYRIALLQVLCIPTHEPDADAQTYERAEDANPAAIDLFSAVLDAKTESQLRKAWESVRDALADGRINAREAGQLNDHVKRRQPEVAGDGTGDGDRGGAEPGAVGAGPRSDGESAAERGPGGDEGPGSGRPGLQPGVHRGAGLGRPAQASGGRGDTPAAVGGGRG